MSETPPNLAELSVADPGAMQAAPAEAPLASAPKEHAPMFDIHPAHHAANSWKEFFVVSAFGNRQLAILWLGRTSGIGQFNSAALLFPAVVNESFLGRRRLLFRCHKHLAEQPDAEPGAVGAGYELYV